MSYVKLHKVCADFAVGIQSINQARDNNTAHADLLDVKHSLGVGGQSPPGQPFAAVGRHDDICIARTVAHFRVDTLQVPTRLVPVLSGPMMPLFVYSRLQAGQWRIFVSSPGVVFAHATPAASSAVYRKATAYLTASPDQGPSVIVSTWERGTSWALADFDFSLVFWAKR